MDPIALRMAILAIRHALGPANPAKPKIMRGGVAAVQLEIAPAEVGQPRRVRAARKRAPPDAVPR